MTEIVAYELVVDANKSIRGFDDFIEKETEARDQILRIREEIKRLNADLKKNDRDTSKSLDDRMNQRKELVRLISVQSRNLKEVTKEQRFLNKEFDGVKAARGSYDKLDSDIKRLTRSYKALSDEARSGISGREQLDQIRSLRSQLSGKKEDLGQTFISAQNYRDAITQALEGQGTLFSNLSSATNSLLSSPIAIGGAVVTGFAALASHVNEVTTEFIRLRGQVQTLADVSEPAIDSITNRIQAISKTFDEDFNEVLITANTLTKELTGDFDRSLEIIETGFLSGTNVSGEFLDVLKEYPVFFKEAGFSAEQALNIINRQVEDGIYSDKGIDAIKEATISLRELPKTALDALNAIGISGEQIQAVIDERGLAGAIQFVSQELNNFEDDSREAGQVLADIFKGAGEDAGITFVKSLQDIDNEVNDLIDSTNVLTRLQIQQLEAEQNLASAQNRLSKTFQDLKTNTAGLITQTKAYGTELLNVITNTLRFGQLGGAAIIAEQKAQEATQEIISKSNAENEAAFKRQDEILRNSLRSLGLTEDQINKQLSATISDTAKEVSVGFKELQERQKELREEIQDARVNGEPYLEQLKEYNEITNKIAGATGLFSKAAKAQVELNKLQAGSTGLLKKEISDLNSELESNAPNNLEEKLREIAAKKQELEGIENQIDAINNKIAAEQNAGLFDATTIDLETTSAAPVTGEDLSTSAIERIKREQAEETEKLKLQVIADRIKKEIELEEAAIEKRKQLRDQLQTALLDAADSIVNAQIENSRRGIERELDEQTKSIENASGTRLTILEEQLKNQEISEQEFTAKKLALDQETATQIEAAEKEAANRRKDVAIKEALIQGGLAIVKTFAQFGFPFGVIPAAAQAVQTGIQVALIRGQEFRKGGILDGPSHERGGIQLMSKTGQHFGEAEGKEPILTNKVTANKKLLSLASFANEEAGGVSLTNNKMPKDVLSVLNEYISSGRANYRNRLKTKVPQRPVFASAKTLSNNRQQNKAIVNAINSKKQSNTEIDYDRLIDGLSRSMEKRPSIVKVTDINKAQRQSTAVQSMRKNF